MFAFIINVGEIRTKNSSLSLPDTASTVEEKELLILCAREDKRRIFLEEINSGYSVLTLSTESNGSIPRKTLPAY